MILFYFNGPQKIITSCILVTIIFTLNVSNEIIKGASAKQPKEKISVLIDKLRTSMLPRIPPSSYVYEFVKHDLYLLRWLEANSYNIEVAEKQMINHMQWRAHEKMDTIETEDWTDFQREYPIFADTVDRIGSPVGEVWFSEWEVRRAVVSGQTKKLKRWLARLAEIQTRRLYEARANGRNVTHSLLLWDVNGFNLLQHGCNACNSVFTSMCNVFETHYPNLWGRIMLLNMNQAFETILTTIQPFLKPSTRQVMYSYYTRNQWKNILDRLVDRGQRSIRFGGTIKRDD